MLVNKVMVPMFPQLYREKVQKNKPILLVAFLFLSATWSNETFGKDEVSVSSSSWVTGRFPYIFAESTGQNEWIMVDGKKMPIRIVSLHSDKSELSALRDLTTEILYPNSEGKGIVLVGKYCRQSTALPSGRFYPDPPGSCYHKFALSHWYIRHPFFKNVPITKGGSVLPTFRQVKCNQLNRNDFNPPIKIDPSHFLQ